jgi:starch-binding outer membrane protein, SusD/RagB family
MIIKMNFKIKHGTKLLMLMTAFVFSTYSCSDEFLERKPFGALGDAEVSSKAGVELLLIGAYGILDGNIAGDDPWRGSGTNWVFGSVVGGDANKGTNAGDQADINEIQRFSSQPTNPYFNYRWRGIYEGITRCNNTIRAAKKLSADIITDAERAQLILEAKFLRGHYHFEAKKMWGNVPFIDETISYEKGNFTVSNEADIWSKIEADFKSGYDSLDALKAQIGRANKWAAAAYLAKAYMFQKKYTEALPLLNKVLDEGVAPDGDAYALAPSFHMNFNVEYENGKGYTGTESIFAIQASVNDGGGAQNSNADQVLNYPYNGGPTGCCGFFQPSFELVNSYRTSAGLPLLDGSYNTGGNQVKNDQGIKSSDPFTLDAGTLDPRLDWTVGRRGVPFLDWGKHPGIDWIRDQSTAGPYANKKNIFYSSQKATYTDGSSWTPGYTALNYVLIRVADAMLWAAECEVEIGSLDNARVIVNQIRDRADNVVVMDGGSPAANYDVDQYAGGGVFPFDTKDNARKAVHFERKLELAMEGHRFFDLVRWGEAETTLNAYLTYEGAKLPTYLGGAKFTPNQDEYYPIPQRQIDLSGTTADGKTVLQQNDGY